MKIDKRLGLFVALAGTFVTALVVGDILGGKLTQVHLFGKDFVVSVGMIPFPITFLLTDLLNEFYGKRAARFVTLAGFGMALFAYATIFVAMALPWAPFTRAADWPGMNEGSFDNVFNGSKRILVGSMVAYLVAQFVDIGMFHLLKQKTGGRFLWLRATGSTVASQLIDTFVITFIAWTGLRAFGDIVEMALTSYVIKLLVAIGLTPAIYAGHAIVERSLGIQPVQLDESGEVMESLPSSGPSLPLTPAPPVLKLDRSSTPQKKANAMHVSPMVIRPRLVRRASAKVPTKFGELQMISYREEGPVGDRHDLSLSDEPIALVAGDVRGKQGVPVRVHSECITSEVFGSLKCDCKQQLEAAQAEIVRRGEGAILYLRQEGRGIGLANKLRAYALQAEGADTVDANRMLGLPDDARRYDVVASMLDELGIRSVRLMTNNPAKEEALRKLGVSVEGRMPVLVAVQSAHAAGYLDAKRRRMRHVLPETIDVLPKVAPGE